MQKVMLTINGIKIEAQEGRSVLQAALNAGIYIPHLCYHPDLTPQGGCKLCVVEVDGREGAVTACTTEVKPGMAISTQSASLAKIRGLALELMLASHPADCTACSVYLNCELQAVIQYLGVTHSRLRRVEKRHIRINTKNPLIVREMERCIQCGRCIRACSELRGVTALRYNEKDGEIYVGTEGDLPLKETPCRFCGACVEVCPTGALHDVEGVFAKEAPRDQALIPCSNACPVNIDIPAFVRLIAAGKYSEAVGVIREKAPFPLTLGYVCNRKCEAACRREKLNSSIAIRDLKRFAVETDMAKIWSEPATRKRPATGKKVAIIGAGPAGLTAAYYLAKKGHAVTVYEKLPLAGGMLAVGIPEYRLPGTVVQREVEFIKALGVTIITNQVIDSVDQLKQRGYQAILIAIGAHLGRKLGVGLNLEKIYAAVDFLRRVSLREPVVTGPRVVVIGGGSVAFDCARTAVRLGVEAVSVLCLEDRGAMLADPEEIAQGEAEGIQVNNSRTILTLEGTGTAPYLIRHIGIKQFSFDVDGQLNSETVPGSEAVTEADTIIFAAGQIPQIDASFGVELVRGNRIAVEAETLSTSQAGVFAAGDAVYGTKSVIEAIAGGRKAAVSMDRYLGGDGDIREKLVEPLQANGKIGPKEGFSVAVRMQASTLDVRERKAGFELVDCGFTPAQAERESERCLQCDLRVAISKVKFWGDYQKA